MNQTSPTTHVDLLIVGAGPAGLTAACWATQYPVSTLIIDQKSCRTQAGHADGLQSRTLEILDSFGIAGPILENEVNIVEACYWELDHSTGNIERRERKQSNSSQLSRFGQALLNQGAVEQVLLDYLQKSGNTTPQWRTRAESLHVADAGDEYPITVKVRRIREHREDDSTEETTETVHARYLVGSDGAHGWTRTQLGVPSDRSSEDSVWGVLDIVPITDFPDIRESCAIQTEPYGCIMTVPRENRLVRFYIPLGGDSEKKKAHANGDHSPNTLLEIVQKAIKPYRLTYKHCDWWSLYTVGQHLVKQYRPHQRILLAGDAAHTHSPKGGLGMNVAIQDTYNLGWKLGSVITGDLDPLVLETYGVERYPVAKELMELDARLVHAYEEGESCKASRIEEIREQYAGFMAGVDVAYPSSIVVAKEDTTTSDYSPFARKLKLGMRIPSFPVIYHCDGTTVHLAQRLTCTGMWRLLVFPGDITQPSRRDTLAGFSDAFSKNQQHWLAATSAQSSSEQRFPCLEPILVHSSRRHAVSLLDLPDIFHPFDDALGWDYWRVFSDRTPQGSESGLACETYGMDKNGPGCLVLCRPDQHVAWAGGLGDAHALNEYLSGLCRGRG